MGWWGLGSSKLPWFIRNLLRSPQLKILRELLCKGLIVLFGLVFILKPGSLGCVQLERLRHSQWLQSMDLRLLG